MPLLNMFVRKHRSKSVAKDDLSIKLAKAVDHINKQDMRRQEFRRQSMASKPSHMTLYRTRTYTHSTSSTDDISEQEVPEVEETFETSSAQMLDNLTMKKITATHDGCLRYTPLGRYCLMKCIRLIEL